MDDVTKSATWGPKNGKAPVSAQSNLFDRKPRAAEFFAGIGLVRLALENQGWEVVFANDNDPKKIEMYRHYWKTNDHLVEDDIYKLKAEDVPDIEMATASFPCNDLSIAGKWEGLDGKKSSAFWEFIRILREMDDRRPQLVLLENVVGFLTGHGGRDFHRAMMALNDLSYTVDAFILNAWNWVPQSRARLFVLAKKDDGPKRENSAVTSAARPEALTRFIAANQQIRWDIGQLPALPARSLELEKIIEDDKDVQWWNAKRTDYFMNQLSPRHSRLAEEMVAGATISYATAFRRIRNEKSMAELRKDGIAGCLRTPRGGSAARFFSPQGKASAVCDCSRLANALGYKGSRTIMSLMYRRIVRLPDSGTRYACRQSNGSNSTQYDHC